MKKIISGILSAVCAFTSLNSGITAFADEQMTPSGIKYSNIGDEIDNYIQKYESGLASCELAVFNDQKTIFTGYYGCCDIENNISADETTVYEWGSCSKLLVWTSVMQLNEQGRLDLDEDIRTYLPGGFLTKLQYKDEKITMKNLMNHDAGFQESYYENPMCDKDGLYGSLEDAVKACECYQSYHVGEHTAYSNWGTALAGYIVERVSGEEYAQYVHKNIFKPLGMEHTSIEPDISDNDYVSQNRNKLKCYSRYEDKKYNEDYGTCISWVQLFPAGSAMGTLNDFIKFGSAFLKVDCPLFENDMTRDMMLTPTSYYGDTNIAKNCHGLWTSEYKVQALGHSGNTTGCTADLTFDPVSRLGFIAMVNEPGETKFTHGIPELVFGQVTDRPEFKNAVITQKQDLSGLYKPSRRIAQGAGRMSLGGMPWKLNDDGTYSPVYFGFNNNKDCELIQLADKMYLWKNNGMNTFMYQSTDDQGRPQLEMMSTDYILSAGWKAEDILIYAFIFLGVVCVISLTVSLIIFIVRKISKSDKKFNKQIIIEQIICTAISADSMIHLGFIEDQALFPDHEVTIFMCIIMGLFALISLANGSILLFKTIRSRNIGVKTAVHRYIWSIISILSFLFILIFQMYNFWSL